MAAGASILAILSNNSPKQHLCYFLFTNTSTGRRRVNPSKFCPKAVQNSIFVILFLLFTKSCYYSSQTHFSVCQNLTLGFGPTFDLSLGSGPSFLCFGDFDILLLILGSGPTFCLSLGSGPSFLRCWDPDLQCFSFSDLVSVLFGSTPSFFYF